MRLQLKVKMLTGEEYTVKVPGKISVLDLKKSIAQQTKVPAYSQRLATEGGEQLLNWKLLSEHKVKTGDMLLLLVEEDQSMDILVRNSNHTNAYRIQLNQTVAQLKKMVQEKETIRVGQFNLTFGEKVMQDKDYLGDYDLSPLSTIQLNLELRGGAGGRDPRALGPSGVEPDGCGFVPPILLTL